MPKTTKHSRLIVRSGVILDTAKARALNLTWGRRKDGRFMMTRQGWIDARAGDALAEAEIFVKAARLIAEDKENYGCYALAMARGRDRLSRTSECAFFTATLKPPGSLWVAWYEGPMRGAFWEFEKIAFARTLGLLLCAELVKDGWTPPGWLA